MDKVLEEALRQEQERQVQMQYKEPEYSILKKKTTIK